MRERQRRAKLAVEWLDLERELQLPCEHLLEPTEPPARNRYLNRLRFCAVVTAREATARPYDAFGERNAHVGPAEALVAHDAAKCVPDGSFVGSGAGWRLAPCPSGGCCQMHAPSGDANGGRKRCARARTLDSVEFLNFGC
jgi:hypothetical protein